MDEIYLRSLRRDDLDRVHAWHNDPALYESLVHGFRHVSRAAEEAWLEKQLAYSLEQVSLAICLRKSNEHIGNIYLRSIDLISRNAEVGLFIGVPAARAKGHGAAAIRLITDHAFEDLGLRRLFCLALSDNLPSVKAFRKCGFTVEGTMVRHAYKRGQFKDVVILGLCR